jgi:CheY-like chemotaxis protein
MDGISLALAMKADARLHSIPIIVVTASVMDNERQASLAAGCLAFVEKPFDIARLRALVTQAIEDGEPLDDLE